MSTLGRDVYRRKLERYLAHCFDEPTLSLISAVVAVQSGKAKALRAVRDLPPEAVGAELGSPYFIAPWTLETLVNELLATPKPPGFGVGRTRAMDPGTFGTLRVLNNLLVKLENAEDGIFLKKHDVFYEMARIAQRQFPWQRGVFNAPHLYRSILLYGTGSAREFFEGSTGISVPDFVKIGICMSQGLAGVDYILRDRDLSAVGITVDMREAALARLAIPHQQARVRTARIRAGNRHTAYRPSILRDFPIVAFGDRGERLRAPIPELVIYRYTSGLYLDVVRGGAAVWTDIGRRFETYVLEYFQAMMSPYEVIGEQTYGPKKARYRTPDVLISNAGGVVAAIECKAKRMTFDARFADDPTASSSVGFDELAKGIFQIWRFLSHARRGVTGEIRVEPHCRGVIVTADGWLTMASKQAETVLATAHALADAEGGIDQQDRREIAFCPIDDAEFALQFGSGDSFLAACNEIAAGEKKGFMLSVAHAATRDVERPYPFVGRMPELLPWLSGFELPTGDGA